MNFKLKVLVFIILIILKSINFDIISSDLTQDAYSVVRGFRILREQEFFRRIHKPDYVVWVDTGKCFRNNEFMGYLMVELARDNVHGNRFI